MKVARLCLAVVFFILAVELFLNMASIIYVKSNKRDSFIIKKGAVKIMCIGDSHTWGFGSKSEESYPSRLEVMLNTMQSEKKFQTINLGVPGMNSAMIAKQLKNKYFLYNPDIVIINGGSNNHCYIAESEKLSYDNTSVSCLKKVRPFLADTICGTRTYKFLRIFVMRIKYRTFTGKPDLIFKDMKIDRRGNLWNEITVRRDGDFLETIRYAGNPDIPVKWGDHGKITYNEAYKDFIKKTYENMVIFLSRCHTPVVLQTYLCNDPMSSYKLSNEAIVEFAEDKGIPVIRNDSYIERKQLKRDELLIPDGHPNSKGYSIMAENAYNTVVELLNYI